MDFSNTALAKGAEASCTTAVEQESFCNILENNHDESQVTESMTGISASKSLLCKLKLRDIYEVFPSNFSYCFAYGSGVFRQKNQSPGKMVDLIFVVDDPQAWHAENIKMNAHHYSFLRFLGPRLVSLIQEKMACGVYYNPYAYINNQLVKYGVVSTKSFMDDLNHWSHIYVAGRLHKPVLDIKPPSDPRIIKSIRRNRESAVRVALLQQSRQVTKFNLYHTITEISYIGDTRMLFAESPEKTKNIVSPLLNEFDAIYFPILKDMAPQIEINDEGLIIQDNSPKVKFQHLMALPLVVQVNLAKRLQRDPRLIDIEDSMAELSYLPSLRNYIRFAIGDVVWSSSVLQTAQGFLSSGILRGLYYAFEKVRKHAGAHLLNSSKEKSLLNRSRFDKFKKE